MKEQYALPPFSIKIFEITVNRLRYRCEQELSDNVVNCLWKNRIFIMLQ